MQQLQKNVKNIWAEQGPLWLSHLPTTIEFLARYWSLTRITPVNNMSYNYVAFAMQATKKSVVLKISCDANTILAEYRALQYFAGYGAIKILDFSAKYNALLLEQALPGYLLKDYQPLKIEEIIQIYARVVTELAKHPTINNQFIHVSDWCDSIDKITDPRINKNLQEKAQELKSKLLSSIKYAYYCHGDLHLENIIQHHSNWLVIDPKGVMGEMAFEAAAFDLLTDDERKDPIHIPIKIVERVRLLSQALDVQFNRLLAWFFLRTMLSAQWFIEDKGDPSDRLELAEQILPLLADDF